MGRLIDDEAAVNALTILADKMDESGAPVMRQAIEVLRAMEEYPKLDESCTDCPLYDKERYSCPRFNRVIPETLRELRKKALEENDEGGTVVW